MADLAFLSLWFRDFTIAKGVEHLQAALELFPLSAAKPELRLVIRSLDPAQSSSLETELVAVPGAVRQAAGEFLHDDTAYEVTAHWDLWQPRGKAAWEQAPTPVEFLLQGEEFDDARFQETGHLWITLGLEQLYLGSRERLEEAELGFVRENVGRLYAFLRPLSKGLPIARQRLWSESRPDLAALLEP